MAHIRPQYLFGSAKNKHATAGTQVFERSLFLGILCSSDLDLLSSSNPIQHFSYQDFETFVTVRMASLFHRTASKWASFQHLRHLPHGKKTPALSAFFSSSSRLSAIKNVMVIGSGLMGAGIAQVRSKFIPLTSKIVWR